ncbi:MULTISPECIES: transposase [unclassified Ensifer]|nr:MULTISPECIES: transposase [unclassified Ensifer]MBD9490878.1 transposase [Ensifer sp. ENS11]MDP9633460.1 putative transposase [Ensifer adhaerens]
MAGGSVHGANEGAAPLLPTHPTLGSRAPLIRPKDTIMGKRKFDDDEIMGILREHRTGATVAEVCHRHGISEPTFYRWQSSQLRTVGFDVGRIRALELENQKLKKLLAEAMLTAATLSEMLAKASK